MSAANNSKVELAKFGKKLETFSTALVVADKDGFLAIDGNSFKHICDAGESLAESVDNDVKNTLPEFKPTHKTPAICEQMTQRFVPAVLKAAHDVLAPLLKGDTDADKLNQWQEMLALTSVRVASMRQVMKCLSKLIDQELADVKNAGLACDIVSGSTSATNSLRASAQRRTSR